VSEPKRVEQNYASVAPRPEIVVDFAIEQGLLHVSLRNVGSSSAYRVRTVFDKPFHGLGGEKCISAMRVFSEVPFMPPQKEFTQYVDLLVSYAKRKEPLRLKATVSYTDRDGNRYQETQTHDLRIFLESGRAGIAASNGGE
jgi:hypothetical protein